MTQHAQGSGPIARMALVAAALAAAFAIGFTISSEGEVERAGQAGTGDAVGTQSIASLEAQTKASPRDARAWQRLGLAYYSESRFTDAARAYEKAAGITPDDALTWSALGEARVMASERDPMPSEALSAFKRAVAIDPKDPRARYFLAVKRDLDGDHKGAIADWLAQIEETPEDAPWRGDLIRTVEQVGQINGIEVAPRIARAKAKSPQAPPLPVAARAIPGPTPDELAAASQIPPGEQRKMAEGMVARLEERLKGDRTDINGWIMLIRSRVTLGEPDKAARALRDAVAANPASAEDIRRQAAMLGVE